jgi:hypothetical protein
MPLANAWAVALHEVDGVLVEIKAQYPSDRRCDRNEQHRAALGRHPAHPACPRRGIRISGPARIC